MSTGTKTFLVAALMAIVALSGSLGASNARADGEWLEQVPTAE